MSPSLQDLEALREGLANDYASGQRPLHYQGMRQPVRVIDLVEALLHYASNVKTLKVWHPSNPHMPPPCAGDRHVIMYPLGGNEPIQRERNTLQVEFIEQEGK